MEFYETAEMDMMNVIENLEKRILTVRAGRANAAMLNGIKVEYYGAPTPLNQVANITIPEARQIFIKPFDKSIIKDIERSINEANIGITPTNNGEMVILTIPELTEDTRKNYVKQVKTMGEEAKVALRNARQDAMNGIKKAEELTEDQKKSAEEDIQELINKYNKIVDEKVKEKEDELMSI
jgi:ribosome recycling factor